MNSEVIYNIGTAGWFYEDWISIFYPESSSVGFDMLTYYSDYFNSVEVNSTYYSYISPKIVEGWVSKVHNNFVFHVKLHKDFTHLRNFNNQKISLVINNLDILKNAEKLGGLLIQFPYSFYYSPSALQYILRLREIFSGYKIFVELRHLHWQNELVFQAFKQNNITFCTIDQPQIGQAIQFKPIITNNIVYIRFHGRNSNAWKESVANFNKNKSYKDRSERYNYLYSPGELAGFQQSLKLIEKKVKEINIILNNHPNGNAVVNAFEFMNMLNEKMKIPSIILKNFPRLNKIITGNEIEN